MKPKPIVPFNFIWLLPIWLSVSVFPLQLLSQTTVDSLTVEQLLDSDSFLVSTKVDTLQSLVIQSSQYQLFTIKNDQRVAAVKALPIDSLRISQKVNDTLFSYLKIDEKIPVNSDLRNQSAVLQNKISVIPIEIDVPKIEINQLSELHIRQKQFFDSKPDILSIPEIKHQIDSLSIESLGGKIEEFAINNVEELRELGNMHEAANSARVNVQTISWDKSKISSTKNIAKVIGENVEAVQSGMKKMQDIKNKYSKVNLMNPNGPVLKEISKKPSRPWQFSLNFNSQFKDGYSLQLAPTIGYRLYEKWVGGIGISYQLQIIDKDNAIKIATKHEFSHRTFSQYNFYRNFLVHVEYEVPYNQNLDIEGSSWYELKAQKSKGWLGLAIQYKVYKKIKGQTQVLYDIMPRDYTKPSDSRWRIRINLVY